jgi:hypothetical protein
MSAKKVAQFILICGAIGFIAAALISNGNFKLWFLAIVFSMAFFGLLL